jgi:hypothetical protein
LPRLYLQPAPLPGACAKDATFLDRARAFFQPDDLMVLLDAVILFLAGVLAGAVNAVAGGGTFLAFGVLSLVGMAPITACGAARFCCVSSRRRARWPAR